MRPSAIEHCCGPVDTTLYGRHPRPVTTLTRLRLVFMEMVCRPSGSPRLKHSRCTVFGWSSAGFEFEILTALSRAFDSASLYVDVEALLYVHRNRRFIRDGSPGRPPRLSHSSWTLLYVHLVECCFTSTDDFHTAPERCYVHINYEACLEGLWPVLWWQVILLDLVVRRQRRWIKCF